MSVLWVVRLSKCQTTVTASRGVDGHKIKVSAFTLQLLPPNSSRDIVKWKWTLHLFEKKKVSSMSAMEVAMEAYVPAHWSI